VATFRLTGILRHVTVYNANAMMTNSTVQVGRLSAHYRQLPTGVAQRSEVDVFSGVCLFVSLPVCKHDNFRTIKHRTMKLDG